MKMRERRKAAGKRMHEFELVIAGLLAMRGLWTAHQFRLLRENPWQMFRVRQIGQST